MNWQQYRLSKVAEEAAEVAKEAMKCQQFGMDSTYLGEPAWNGLRQEFIDLMAVMAMVADPEPRGLIACSPVNQVVANQMEEKADKVCYYAMFAYKAMQLDLTWDEYRMIQRRAFSYATKHTLESTGSIGYRD